MITRSIAVQLVFAVAVLVAVDVQRVAAQIQPTAEHELLKDRSATGTRR